MSKPLVFFIVWIVSILLFLPVLINGSFHYDMNRKKYAFVIRLYAIKIISGYITVYPGGIAVHLSNKKALVFPYKSMNDDKKRFSFMKNFRLLRFKLTTETGAEYLFPVWITSKFITAYLSKKAYFLQEINTDIWLTDGDVLRVSGQWLVFFNLFIIIKNLFIFLKEKILILWRKKTEKSTI